MQNPQSPSASLSSLCPPCRHLCIVLKDFFRLRFYHTNVTGVKKKFREPFTRAITQKGHKQPPDPPLKESGSAPDPLLTKSDA